MSNIYYEPEDFGLEIIKEMEFGGCYEFDTHILFKHTSGKIYYAHSAGCSCPVPFEEYDGLESLEEITSESFQSFRDHIMNLDDGEIGEKREFIQAAKGC